MSPEEKMALAFSPEGERRAREYLMEANRLDSRIALALSQLDAVRARGTRMAHLMEQASSGGPGDKVGSAAAQAADLEKEVLSDYEALLQKQRAIKSTLRSLPEGMRRMLLEMRYLQAQPFFRIAMALHVEERHVYRLHKQALRQTALILIENGEF